MLEVFPGDAEFAHHGVERCAVESEAGRGSGDDAGGFTEDAEDVFAFDLFEGGAALGLRRGIADFADGSAEVGTDGEDDGAFDKVFEFADVAGPVPVDQSAQGFRGDLIDGAAHFLGVFAGEVAGEDGDVVGPVSERGRGDGEDFEAVVEITPEELVAHHFGEVPIGGGDEANVDGNGANAAEAFEGFLLQGAEELGLEIERDVADFVEEQGSAVGHFEAADFLGEGAGEGAAFVAEEFTFEKAGGDGGAVECNEREISAGAEAMDGAGDEFLAGAGFAEDENGGVCWGDDLDLLLDEAETDAVAYDFIKVSGDGGGIFDAFLAMPDAEVLDKRDPAEGAELDDGGGDEDGDADAILPDELFFVGGTGAKAKAFFVGQFIERSVLDRAEIGPGDVPGLDVFACIADDVEEGVVDIGDLVELAGDDAGDGGVGDLDDTAGPFAAELFVEVVALGEVANDAGEAAEYTTLVLEGHGDGIGPEEGGVRAAVEAFRAYVAGGGGAIEVSIETVGEPGFLLIEHGNVM